MWSMLTGERLTIEATDKRAKAAIWKRRQFAESAIQLNSEEIHTILSITCVSMLFLRPSSKELWHELVLLMRSSRWRRVNRSSLVVVVWRSGSVDGNCSSNSSCLVAGTARNKEKIQSSLKHVSQAVKSPHFPHQNLINMRKLYNSFNHLRRSLDSIFYFLNVSSHNTIEISAEPFKCLPCNIP